MIKKDKNKASFRPLISILIPTYNITKYFNDTLKSINKQSYKNIEVIISDDKSCDVYINKLNDIVRNYNELNIKIYQQSENKGVAFARDFLVEKANGDYVLFLDDDDRLYSKNTILNIVENLEEKTEIYAGNFVFSFDLKSNDPNKSYYVNYLINNTVKNTNKAIDYYLSKITFIWGVLYKKSFLTSNNIKFGEHNLRIFEDIASLGKIYFLCKHFKYTNKPTVRYLRRKNSLSNLNIDKFNLKMSLLEQAYTFNRKQIIKILDSKNQKDKDSLIKKLDDAKFVEFLNLLTQHYLKSCKNKQNKMIVESFIKENILRIKNDLFENSKLKLWTKNMYYLPIFSKIRKQLKNK